MKHFNGFLFALVLLVFVSLVGCFSSNSKDIEAFLKPHDGLLTIDNYILEPPDEITIFSSTIPEMNQQVQRIRPDGKITFESIGEVAVAGKTPRQVAEALGKMASELYALDGGNPIDVRVTQYKSKAYYVFGQVNFPGPQICTGRDSALRALSHAQPTTLAWTEKIQVIRPCNNHDEKPKIFELNLKRMIEHGDTSKNVLLNEGDIIYVPPTILAGIAMKIEELVRPIGRAFSTVNIVQAPVQ